MPRHNPPQSPSNTEVVGQLTSSELEAAWQKVIEKMQPNLQIEGWMTVNQFAKKYRMANSTARFKLNAMLEAGLVETKTVIMRQSKTAVYRPKAQ